MGKVKDFKFKTFEKVLKQCEKLYEKTGASTVIEFVQKKMDEKDPDYADVEYEYCSGCDADMPSLNHTCLVCGQTTKITKQQLVDAVIEDLKKGFEAGDYTVLDELLNKLSVKTLVQSLPEEQWKDYDNLNNSYFEVMSQDFNEDTQRQEIEISCGENGKLMIEKTDEGFVVDVYDADEVLVDTMPIWEDDLNPSEED